MKVIKEDIHGLDFQYYIEAILNQYEYQNTFREITYSDPIDLNSDYVDKRPLFDPEKYSELYPDIDIYHKSVLEAMKKLPNDKLINIINTLILENYQFIEEDERFDGHSDDIATVPNTQL